MPSNLSLTAHCRPLTCPSAQPAPTAVVKRKPAITNTQLTKASRNGNGNGNGRSVSPEEAKVGCRAAGLGHSRVWCIGWYRYSTGVGRGLHCACPLKCCSSATVRSRLLAVLTPPPPLATPAARVCQAAARCVRGPARGRPQAGVGGGAPHRGARPHRPGPHRAGEGVWRSAGLHCAGLHRFVQLASAAMCCARSSPLRALLFNSCPP